MAHIQDINVATRNLYQLLDVMAEVVMNTPADKQGMVARAQALTSIARDEAERIDDEGEPDWCIADEDALAPICSFREAPR
ncbi:hypothetical protein ABMA32_22280 [Mesorhizobium sp. VNQ89]|uniref:hypothetical protein n=1 Tax=Mesorhizobium quangtriensis TaxID=3157709 RepID=UPI0032B7F792